MWWFLLLKSVLIANEPNLQPMHMIHVPLHILIHLATSVVFRKPFPDTMMPWLTRKYGILPCLWYSLTEPQKWKLQIAAVLFLKLLVWKCNHWCCSTTANKKLRINTTSIGVYSELLAKQGSIMYVFTIAQVKRNIYVKPCEGRNLHPAMRCQRLMCLF